MPSYVGFVLTFGIIASLGFAGAANATIVALVAQRFENNRGLIYSICSAGGPLGQMTLASVAAAGVEGFGWRQTMLVFGLVLLVVVLPVVAILLRGAAPPRTELLPSLTETFKLAFKAKGFVLLWWAYFICGVTTLGLVHTHIVAYGADRGLPQINAAGILSLVGLFNIAGLVLAGRLADRLRRAEAPHHRLHDSGVALLWLATATSETSLVLFALVFGLTDMATIPFSAAATVQMFGPRMLGVLTGFLAVAHQTGAAFGSYIAGRGYELFGGYPPVIVASVGVALSAAILCFAMDTRPVLVGEDAPEPGLRRLEPDRPRRSDLPTPSPARKGELHKYPTARARTLSKAPFDKLKRSQLKATVQGGFHPPQLRSCALILPSPFGISEEYVSVAPGENVPEPLSLRHSCQ